jgi:RHS repeat-associated protein
MLDAFGLINMNGRMYDPVLGRMLSPDNYVSLPEHTQGYNRYTYALNNPLIITDPSGDNPVLLFIAFAGVLNGAMSAQNGDGFLQGFAIGTATAALSYGVGTAVGPVVSGGKIWADMANAGIHTAITGGITYGADALVNNAAFNWKGYGLNIATSMAMAGLSYQKPVMQSQSISLDDLEAAGVQPSLGNGYGMSGGGPKKGRYYYYDPPKNKGGHGFKLNSGNTESFLRREYTYPESYIFTTIGGFAGMYSYMNKIISNDFAKEMAPIISRHYGVPTMPVLKYAKHVPYIGWPADAASIGTSLLNGQNFGWTTERKLDAIFSIIGLIPGYGDAASLFYMGGKDGYKALQKIWDVTRIGFNRIENGIKTLPYWY